MKYIKRKYIYILIPLVTMILAGAFILKSRDQLKEMEKESAAFVNNSFLHDYFKDISFYVKESTGGHEPIIGVKIDCKEAFVDLSEAEQYYILHTAQKGLRFSYNYIKGYKVFFDLEGAFGNRRFTFDHEMEVMTIDGSKPVTKLVLAQLDADRIKSDLKPYLFEHPKRQEIYDYVKRLYKIVTREGKYYEKKDGNLIMEDTCRKFDISRDEVLAICRDMFITEDLPIK